MAIDLADQDTAILVTDPLGNGHVIDPRHDTMAGEKVPAVVEADLRHLLHGVDGIEGLVEVDNGDVLLTAARGREQAIRIRCPAGGHVLEVPFQLGVEIHDPRFAVLGQAVGADGKLPPFEIHVPPAEAEGFGDARAGGAHESEAVGELLAGARQARGGGKDRLHLFRCDEGAFFLVHLQRAQVLGGERLEVAVVHGPLEDITQGDDVEVDSARGDARFLPAGDEAVDLGPGDLVEPDVAKVLVPALAAGLLAPDGGQPFGVPGLGVKFKILIPVVSQFGAALEDGERVVAAILLEVLQGVAGLGDGAGTLKPDTAVGFKTGGFVDNGETSVEPAVASPQAANSAFALVVDFLILCHSHAINLSHNALSRWCKPLQSVAKRDSGTKIGTRSSMHS